jgi:hypothetical protein
MIKSREGHKDIILLFALPSIRQNFVTTNLQVKKENVKYISFEYLALR